MIFQPQLNLHRPDEGLAGDCWRTCIACLLDMDAGTVPHFTEATEGPSEYMDRTQAWLADNGLFMVVVPYLGADLQEVLGAVSACNPGLPFMVGCANQRGVDVCVIGKDGAIIHDPSLEPAAPYRPASDGHVWIHFIGRKL